MHAACVPEPAAVTEGGLVTRGWPASLLASRTRWCPFLDKTLHQPSDHSHQSKGHTIAASMTTLWHKPESILCAVDSLVYGASQTLACPGAVHWGSQPHDALCSAAKPVCGADRASVPCCNALSCASSFQPYLLRGAAQEHTCTATCNFPVPLELRTGLLSRQAQNSLSLLSVGGQTEMLSLLARGGPPACSQEWQLSELLLSGIPSQTDCFVCCAVAVEKQAMPVVVAEKAAPVVVAEKAAPVQVVEVPAVRLSDQRG